MSNFDEFEVFVSFLEENLQKNRVSVDQKNQLLNEFFENPGTGIERLLKDMNLWTDFQTYYALRQSQAATNLETRKSIVHSSVPLRETISQPQVRRRAPNTLDGRQLIAQKAAERQQVEQMQQKRMEEERRVEQHKKLAQQKRMEEERRAEQAAKKKRTEQEIKRVKAERHKKLTQQIEDYEDEIAGLQGQLRKYKRQELELQTQRTPLENDYQTRLDHLSKFPDNPRLQRTVALAQEKLTPFEDQKKTIDIGQAPILKKIYEFQKKINQCQSELAK